MPTVAGRFATLPGDQAIRSAKAEVESLLKCLPDDAALEDIQYHIYVLEKIRQGESRAETEGVLAHEDGSRVLKWLGE